MKNTVEVINKLTVELANLSAKIGSLESFLVSKDYQETSGQQKVFVAQQHTAMEQYKEILLKRLVDLRNQEKQEKEMTKAPEEANRDDRIEPHVFSAMEYEAHRQKTSPEAESGTPAD